MARSQQHFEETSTAQPFSDSSPPFSPAASPSPAPTENPGPAPADFFLSCLSASEQQQFLDFCALRNLSPEAGVLAFLKEKLQRSELNTVVNNPFTDEAQAVVNSMQATKVPGFQLGQKPTKACEVCGQPVIIDFLGRMLCKNPQCWHTYAGLSPQDQQRGAVEVRGGETDKRLSSLESMMERIAGMLDKLVGV